MTTAVTITVEDQKRVFAMALLKNPDNAFEAALSVIPDTGIALQAATLWVNDPFVKQCQIDLIEQYGAGNFLPTEVDQLKDIWKIAVGSKIDYEIRLKAHELYAKIRQRYFEKPHVIGNQTNILNQGAMQVVNNGTDEEWEAKLIDQQQKLVQDVQ